MMLFSGDLKAAITWKQRWERKVMEHGKGGMEHGLGRRAFIILGIQKIAS